MKVLKKLFLIGFFGASGVAMLFISITMILLATTPLPDFKSFESRKIIQSTKIYDRTGKVVLYDLSNNIRRSVISFDEMGVNIRNATVAIEDSEFYQHKGIRIKSILRAFYQNVIGVGIKQGGSTITQQVLKNTLLTREKTFSRKIKEWILSIKIETSISKDSILEAYLNETPYGGVVYGIKEASGAFFGKEPAKITLAEAAYLAALPQAPTLYSPYGKNFDKLEARKNTVLLRMKELNFINEEEYQKALIEKVIFKSREKIGIKAPHFVFFVKDYLEEKYGPDAMQEGYKVITTLDIDLQTKTEEHAFLIAQENEKNFEGKNAAVVVLDPKTGQILAMVGSRDYFDAEIDGAYNTAIALRQPGSAFKPFIYATAFKKGYTPDTVLFDVPTEFQTTCDPHGKVLSGKSKKDCYSPDNYDNKFRGPLTIRNALAQSINIPAVQTLYLIGIPDAIRTAREMGINNLTDASRYGLTLVIGGGEVSLLDMTSAYGTFAADGVRHDLHRVLKIEDGSGKILEEFQDSSRTVLEKNVAFTISDILSDNNARIPTFGYRSVLEIPNQKVAVKTGTTNNNRDAWTIGYTPDIVVGVWVGNNDNTPMKKGGAALAGPIWNAVMNVALQTYNGGSFEKPDLFYNESLPPILRGIWQGGESFFIDKISQKLATENTPPETKVEKTTNNVHSILYWIDKNNPTILLPGGNTSDSQYKHWEVPTLEWWDQNKENYPVITEADKPTLFDDIHTPENAPKFIISSPNSTTIYNLGDNVNVSTQSIGGTYPPQKADVFVNDNFLGSLTPPTWSTSFTIDSLDNFSAANTIKIILKDTVYNSTSQETSFLVDIPIFNTFTENTTTTSE